MPTPTKKTSAAERLAKLEEPEAPPKSPMEEMLSAVEKSREDRANQTFNKSAFFEGASSKNARLDETRKGKSEHWVSAEELSLLILERANVAWVHPELVVPFADLLRKLCS